jgi:hypothetical protein
VINNHKDYQQEQNDQKINKDLYHPANLCIAFMTGHEIAVVPVLGNPS